MFGRVTRQRASSNRREFLRNLAGATGSLVVTKLGGAASVLSASRKPTDIRVERVTFGFEDFLYRSPVKFAGALMDRATILNVECLVKTRSGKVATGVGAMPFNHIFSYPSKTMTNEAKNNAMKALAAELAKATENYGEFSDPIDIDAAWSTSMMTLLNDASWPFLRYVVTRSLTSSGVAFGSTATRALRCR